MCLLTIFMPLKRYLFRSSVNFLNGLLVFTIELYEFFICFGYQPFIRYNICKYFLPFIRLHFHFLKFPLPFPGGSMVKNLPTMRELQETWVRSLSQEYPLEESMATHALFTRESLGQRRLEGYSPQGRNESDTTEVTQHSTAQKPFSLMQSLWFCCLCVLVSNTKIIIWTDDRELNAYVF